MAIDQQVGVICLSQPKRLAAELLPLLRNKGETPETLMALVRVSDRDLQHIRERIGETVALRVLHERKKILLALERLLAERNS